MKPSEKRHNWEESIENSINHRWLILHNDNVNTFDYVIETLCEVVHHDEVQAEQCALITHYKGKCDIKKGPVDELVALRNTLQQRELSVTID
jgi:ATP-dependent Clp protease adaptor protein ClpS